MNTPPKTLSTEEQIKFVESFKSRRDRLMVLLMLDAGLRVSEVVNLLQTDLVYCHVPVNVIRITKENTKNKRERTVPLSSRIKHLIEILYKFVWNEHDFISSNYAFYHRRPEIPITTRQVERIVKSQALATLGRPVHPHMLRHTFATRLMQSSNIRVVQELLGHRDIRSTQIYTHPNADDLNGAIAKMEGGDK